MNPYMTAKDWGEDQIDLRHLHHAHQLKPTELHHKSNGSTSDEPSFTMVLEGRLITAIGQFSLATLKDVLGQLGYEIRRLS